MNYTPAKSELYSLEGGGATLADFPAMAGLPELKGKRLLILGAGAMQVPAMEAARAEGLVVLAADGNPAAPGRHHADQFFQVDISNGPALVQLAQELRTGEGLDGVFTAATDFSANVALVAQETGLPGLPLEAARNASSKHRMRSLFARHGVPSPRFLPLAKGEDFQEFLGSRWNLEFPVVVKPEDNMGARGVQRVDRMEDLLGALENAMDFARGGVVVEEFIEGPEFSIDSLVIDGQVFECGLALRHINFPPWFIETGHTLPASLGTQQRAELLEVFARGVAALGIRNGVAKGDIFLGPRGAVIGEIAARLSGGYMSGWTFPLASGIDLTRLAIRQAMGVSLQAPQPVWSCTSAERAVVSIPGVVAAWQTLPDYRQPQTIRLWIPRVHPGQEVRFPRNNVEKAGNVIASSPDPRTAILDAEGCIAAKVARLKPHTSQTEEYLLAGNTPVHRAYPWLETADPASLFQVDGPAAHPDWNYRSLSDTLAALDSLMPRWREVWTAMEDQDRRTLVRAIGRGGLQGGLYLLDSLGNRPGVLP